MKKVLNYSLIPVIALLLIVSVITIRCKKPTDGLSITVNTSTLFHYTALVQVVDNSGRVPSGLSVEVTGPDAAAVYGLDGKKALTAPGGIIVAAIHPKMEPTASHTLSFNLAITGDNYLPLIVPVTIAVDQPTQTIKLPILNLTVQTAGVASASKTAAAVNGVVTTTTTVTTANIPGDPSKTSITLPAGTQLQDANGNVISASSVKASVNTFAPSSAIDLFPGGQLASSNIVNEQGNVTSAVFLPAGFANIDMTAGGVAVKKFSSPITISMTLDPSFKDPKTGNTIAVGTALAIYSYSTDTGQWKFEQNGTVTAGAGGTLVLSFQTTHLTEYMAGATLDLLTKFTINIAAPWYVKGTATNIKVSAAIPNGPSYNIFDQTFQLDSLLKFVLDGKLPVPAAGSSIVFTFKSIDDVVLGTATLSASATSIDVTLTPPQQKPSVTLALSLDCRDAKQNAIIVAPDFYLLYKPAGAPAANYTVLGQVQNGNITTNQLDATTPYDFKAIFNSHSKEVLNHTIANDNTVGNSTVGYTSFNGKVVPERNKVDIKALCESLP